MAKGLWALTDQHINAGVSLYVVEGCSYRPIVALLEVSSRKIELAWKGNHNVSSVRFQEASGFIKWISHHMSANSY